MALVVKDRVRETSVTQGTGTFTLDGAVTGYQSFTAIGNGNTTYYTIYLQASNEWEVGIGTYTASGTTLSRDTILASSNGGSVVNFSAGTKDVFVTYPAGRSVYYDTATNVTVNALTLSGGSANGVLYLDASKVATSGSALTFDATTLNFGGASQRITGDFSNATHSNRLLIQSNVVNGNTIVGIIPNGTATTGQLNVYSAAGAANTSVGQFTNNGTTVNITSNIVGSGTYLPLVFSAGGNERVRITTTGGFETKPIANGHAVFNEDGVDADFRVESDTDTHCLFVDASTNNVGIGTNAPTFKLEVNVTNTTAYSSTAYSFEPVLLTNLGAGGVSGLLLQAVSTGTANTAQATISAFAESASSKDTVLAFGTRRNSDGAVLERARITSGGDFLVGKTTTYGDEIAAFYESANASRYLYVENPNSGTSTAAIINANAGAGGDLRMAAYGTNHSTQANNASLFNHKLTGSLLLGTEGTERARITSDGTFQTSLDASIYGVTVGRGAGAVATNTVVGNGALAANTTGNQNVAVGYQALTANTTEINNTAVGYRALAANTTGGVNSAFGSTALVANTTGNYNTAIGAQSLSSNTTGSNNTAIGYQAAYLNQTGTRLVAIGQQALYNNTTGYNVAIGARALYSNTTGVSNIAIGTFWDNVVSSPLYSNTTGVANIAVGNGALTGNTFGNQNTGIGVYALNANSTGSNNTAVGYQAGYSNTFGTENVFFGIVTGFANTTGNYNVAYGSRALSANTTGSNNTAIGHQALQANTVAANNTAVGFQAAYSNTIGASNVAMGQAAMYSNTTGGSNTAVGQVALYGNTTGGANTALGQGALYTNSAGANNTAVGFQALVFNTTSNNNTAVGYQAGYSNAIAGNGTFVGFQSGLNAVNTVGTLTAIGAYSLFSNTTGNENSAIGSNALYSNTVGSNNTAVGRQALQSNTTASNNTAVGYQAGYANTTGSANTFVGYQAGTSVTFSNGQTFVGFGAGGAKTTGGNNTFIGTSAGALATTGTGNTFVGVNDSTNGAGYAVTYGSKNTIIGGYTGNQGGLDIRTASNYIVLSDGDGNPRQIIDNSGRLIVGGTTAYGSAATFTAAQASVVINQTSSVTYAGLRIYNDQGSSVRALEIDYSGSAYSGALITNGPTGESAAITTTGAYPLALGTNNTARAVITSGGNFGIGTNNPSYDLQVGTYGTDADSTLALASTTTGTGSIRFGDGTAGVDANAGVIRYDHSADAMLFWTVATERARITSGGYFKASNTGGYDNVNGTFHELLNNDSGDPVVQVSHFGATSPNGIKLDFTAASPDDNTQYFLRCADSTAARCFIYSDGDLANHDGVYGTISDQRLKQDIVDAGSQWADIKAIRFRKYRMKSDVAANPNAPALLGVVAQELEQVSPGLVDEHFDADGEVTKTVKSSILLMKAAVALQEAMARIEKLEAEVAALKGV